MSISIIPKIELIWKKLISELILTQNEHHHISTEESVWIVQNILAIVPILNPEILYKNLVYLNRKSTLGRFALNYSAALLAIIKNKDSEELKFFFEDAFTPEYDDNPYLTKEELSTIKSKLQSEMLTYNHLSDRIFREDYIPETIFKSEIHNKCSKEICLYSHGLVENSENNFIYLDSRAEPIWVSQIIDKSTQAFCFDLIELLIIILNNDVNPYTGKVFHENIRQKLFEKYKIEFKLLRRYFDTL